MGPNTRLLEQTQIVWGFGPVNMVTAANTGDAVSLKNYRRCLVLFVKGIGTAGDDPTLTVLQGTDVAFGTNKALTFTDIFVKADLTSLNQIGQWTQVTQAAANTYVDTTHAEQAAIYAVEFKAEDLDIKNNYDCIRASVADVGTAANTQLGTLLYILSDPIFSDAPENMASAIVD